MFARHIRVIPGSDAVTRRLRRTRYPLLATAARIAHDIGLAAWFGGAAMGAVGLNAATREVEDVTQRIRVANAGWFRWAPVTAVAIAAHLGGTIGRTRWAGTRPLIGRSGPLSMLRLLATGAAVGATVESGRSGRQVIAGGDVPAATAVVPISDTPAEVAAAMGRLRVMQWIMPVATAAIWVINALQGDDR